MLQSVKQRLEKSRQKLPKCPYKPLKYRPKSRGFSTVCLVRHRARLYPRHIEAHVPLWQIQTVPGLYSVLLGLIIGSFLNVCILRIPEGLSVAKPRSRCPGCQKPIAAYDNIPVVSWLILGGKCRHCKTKISPMYPAIELLTGALFYISYRLFGLNVVGAKWAIFSALLVVL